MTERVTRRLALQWIGGLAAGVILSPAPYALIDDLTIATQTRGRSTRLPRGPLDVVRTRCSACPRACSLIVHTVGGRPYLVAPAPGHAISCALRPAVHHLALRPDRLHHALEIDPHGDAAMTTSEGVARAVEWLGSARDRNGAIALVDLSGRDPVGTPMHGLARALGSVTVVDALPHWLDALGERFGLDRRHALCIDPGLAEHAAFLAPAIVTGAVRGLFNGAPIDAIVEQLRSAHATGVLLLEDGVGARMDDAALDRIAEILTRLDAVGRGRLLTTRARLGATTPLADVPDGSVDILVVDAAHPMGAVAWRRLRRTLHPTHGRMIVFATGRGPATTNADLVLPAHAPLEVQETVGGERVGRSTRLALSDPVLPAHAEHVDAHDLAAMLDPSARAARGAEALADDLAGLGRGEILFGGGARSAVAGLEPSEVAEALRTGAVWEDAPDELDLSGPIPRSHDETAARPPRLVLEGAFVLASGERVPDVLSKLAIEHPLLPRAGRARAHPDLIDGLRERGEVRCRVQTAAGTLDLNVRADASVLPGVVLAGAGLGPAAFGDRSARRRAEPLEILDFDPRAQAPLSIDHLEVTG